MQKSVLVGRPVTHSATVALVTSEEHHEFSIDYTGMAGQVVGQELMYLEIIAQHVPLVGYIVYPAKRTHGYLVEYILG